MDMILLMKSAGAGCFVCAIISMAAMAGMDWTEWEIFSSCSLTANPTSVTADCSIYGFSGTRAYEFAGGSVDPDDYFQSSEFVFFMNVFGIVFSFALMGVSMMPAEKAGSFLKLVSVATIFIVSLQLIAAFVWISDVEDEDGDWDSCIDGCPTNIVFTLFQLAFATAVAVCSGICPCCPQSLAPGGVEPVKATDDAEPVKATVLSVE